MDDEQFRSLIIGWVVAITIIFGILFPFTVNIPALPAIFYKIVTEQANGPPVVDYVGGQQYTTNPAGLLVYYDFEVMNKNIGFFDRSWNNNLGYINGIQVGQGYGIIGNSSLSLPGTGYLYCRNDPVAGSTNVSISLWYTVIDKGHNYQLAGGMTGDGLQTGWMIGSRTSALNDKAGDPIRVQMTSSRLRALPFSSNGNNYKVLVYNGSYVTEYLNGVVIGEFTASGKPIAPSGMMTIGSWKPFGNNYAGKIDEFRIYSRPLSSSEVQEAYADGLKGRVMWAGN